MGETYSKHEVCKVRPKFESACQIETPFVAYE